MNYYNVYLIESEYNDTTLYKIGITKRPVEKRLKEFKTGNASNFKIIDTFRSKWGTKIESTLHRYYSNKRVSGEWFNLEIDDINDFISRCESIHNNMELLASNNTYIIEKNIL